MFSPGIQSADEKFLLHLSKVRFRFLTWIMILFTWTGKGRCWVAVAVSVNLLNRYALVINPYFANAFYAPLLVWMINGLIKRKVARARPPIASKNIIPLVRQGGFSFPSSHAGSTFSFFFILLWWKFPEAPWIALWALIVSFSRMYLGVHYLSDVIAGIAVGLAASGIVYLVI